MLTLALATIVVLTVASLALMLWPEAPPPDADDRAVPDEMAVEEDGDRDNSAS